MMLNADTIKELPITWGLIYKSLILIDLHKDNILKNPKIQTITGPQTAGGRSVKNPGAYRRSSGTRAVSRQRNLLSHEAAWLLFYTRSLEIAKFLYKYQLKNAAAPIYTLGKFLEKNPYSYESASRMFFRSNKYPDMIPDLVSFVFSKKMKQDIQVSFKYANLKISLGSTLLVDSVLSKFSSENHTLKELQTLIDSSIK